MEALSVGGEPKSKWRPALSAGTRFEMLSLVRLTVKNVKGTKKEKKTECFRILLSK